MSKIAKRDLSSVMNIVYIHGYQSSVKNNHPKYDSLKSLYDGNVEIDVYPIAPSYDRGYDVVMEELRNHIKKIGNVDLIIGTSMGGYSSSLIGNELNIPFISLNPVINPINVKRGNLQGFPDFSCSEHGFVFLNNEDEIIDSYKSAEFFEENEQGFWILEGEELHGKRCHRFSNLDEIIYDIELFYESWLFFNEADNGSFNFE